MTSPIQQYRIRSILLTIEERSLADELLRDGAGQLLGLLRLLFDFQFTVVVIIFCSAGVVVQSITQVLLRLTIVAEIGDFGVALDSQKKSRFD